MMRRLGAGMLAAAFLLGLSMAAAAGGKQEAAGPTGKFPAGKMVAYFYGNPQYRMQYFDAFLARNKDIAPDVKIEIVQTQGEADARQKVLMSFTAAAWDDLPTVVQTAPVSLQAMAEADALMDMGDFIKPLKDKFVEGSFDQILFDGKYYGFPRSLRPQLLFYNIEIFKKYGIDPKEMDTVEGWIEVGRKLKKLSNGEVFLSYEDPGNMTWRYYGRRGLLPQANAKVWDEAGNVVIDKDPGAKLAFAAFEALHKEGLLLKTAMMKPPLYDATRQGKIATYNIGAFWDEFLRLNDSDMAGKWRAMPAPMFKDAGKRGAPVVEIECLVKKPKSVYAEFYKKYLMDFNFNGEARKDWTNKMVQQNAPYPNPITKELLADPFWKEPSPYYGGQSFREMESLGLANPATNMRVTIKDAEADMIISTELEKFVAGDQTMQQAIENMGKILRSKIGKAPAAR